MTVDDELNEVGHPESAVADDDASTRTTYEADVPTPALLTLALIVVLTVLVVGAMSSAQQLLGLAGLALVVSAAVTPAVERLGRVIGTVTSAVFLHLVLLLIVAAGTAVVLQTISAESTALEEYATAQLEELGTDGAPGLLTRANLSQRVSEAATSWGTIAVVGDDQAAGIAARLSQLLIIVVLSVFFTLSRDRLLDIVMGWIDDRDRRRVLREIWYDSISSASSYFRRALFVGATSGLAAGLVAYVLDLPGVALIGMWAGLLSIVPMLGTVVGWMPIVVLSVINHDSERAVLAAAICVVGVAAIGTFRWKAMRLRARPGSFIVAVGIAGGLSAAGLAGAAAGLFVAAAVATAAAHDWSSFKLVIDTHQSGPTDAVLATTPDGEADGALRSIRMQVSRRTVIRITTLVVLASMIQMSITRIGPTLVWAIVGMLIAVGLDMPVRWVEDRLGASRAIVVIAGAIVIAGGLVALLVTTRWQLDAAPSASEDVPAIVDALEGLPLVGDRLAALDLDVRFARLERDAPRLLSRSPIAGQTVGLLGGGVIGLFWVAVTSLTALLDGPRLIAAVDRRVPARYSRQATRLARASKTAIAGYVGGSATVALLNAILVGSIAGLIGAPIPIVLALWAFTWNFIPQLGAVIGWLPLLVFALAIGPLAGGLTVLFFIIYQAVENNLIQPSIVGQAVDISPLAALGAALFGAAVGGLIGAVLAIPIVGVGRAVHTEYQRDDFPRLNRRRSSATSA